MEIPPGGINSDGRRLPNDWYLKYKAKTKVSLPYSVKWQVVNTGAHAVNEGGLRGGFLMQNFPVTNFPSDHFGKWESTKYTGKHWIECFIIKDSICVARSGKFFVNVTNPTYP